MQSHAFYLTLAYGVGAVLIALEVLLLVQRCRRARKLKQDAQI